VKPEDTVETTVRVRYAETDAMGVVYHANYLVWFEVGRGEYLRSLGQEYRTWEENSYLLPAVEAHIRYRAPARYDDRVVIRTWLQAVRSRSLTLGYEAVEAKSRQVLATGWTRHICIDHEGHARRLPDLLLAPQPRGNAATQADPPLAFSNDTHRGPGGGGAP
jgi:acyl-CoA thioester hydrolase